MKIVFDIGGTNMRVAPVGECKLGKVYKTPTPSKKEEILDTLVEAIEKMSEGNKVEAVTGGIAGVIRDGIITKSPNISNLEKQNLARFLKEKVCEKVSVHNDALMAALGEAVYGAGRRHDSVAYIGFGTGIGGGRIVGENIDSLGFEPGHHILDLALGETWSDKVSGHNLVKKHKNYPQEKLDKKDYDKYVRSIVVGLYNIILLWMPDVLVLGGALINGKNPFEISDIVRELEEINSILPKIPEVKQSELKDNAGLYGAIKLLG